jgi:hypothetical protein
MRKLFNIAGANICNIFITEEAEESMLKNKILRAEVENTVLSIPNVFFSDNSNGHDFLVLNEKIMVAVTGTKFLNGVKILTVNSMDKFNMFVKKHKIKGYSVALIEISLLLLIVP